LTNYTFVRNPAVGGILTGMKNGTEIHNKRWHSKDEKMTIEELLPVRCDLSFIHVPKPTDRLHGQKGERPNYHLVVDDNVLVDDYDDAIPETLKKKDFYEFVKQ